VLQADTARLVVSCRDQQGIIAALSGQLAALGANIIASNQYSTDPEGGTFFLRLEFHLAGLDDDRERLRAELAPIAERFAMDSRLVFPGERKRLAILVSRREHCLLDLLWRWRRRDLEFDLFAVVSNHDDLRREVEEFGVGYHHVPVEEGRKPQAEQQMLELLAGSVDLVVLARYMQILSGDFLHRIGCPVINIHHSFLPAFVGANPYIQARQRGVKLIGATAHYATEDLDEGPIIEQDVMRVRQSMSAHDLERVGADIERMVLARAVHWHLDDRLFVHENRTVMLG
jgi:formyltetrahydrofolate deformylase